ncbi:MAG: ATP--guanido phosphotransferase [Planctomycetota bacterium]
MSAASHSNGDTPGLPLDGRHAPWIGEGRDTDVVLSSRVRLARNIAGFRFAGLADVDDRRSVLEIVRDRVRPALVPSQGDDPGRAAWLDLHASPRSVRDLLVERHLISPQHARGRKVPPSAGGQDPRALLLELPSERRSIMVNEEDHLRIQVIEPGLALGEAAEAIDALDDAIESCVDYAYHPRFGYLTACTTNVGTGIRCSVMLHLPGLRLLGEIDKVRRAAADMSLAIRGFWGEDSDNPGEFYQLSNQTTLGSSEALLLESLLSTIVPRIIEYERLARRRLLETRRSITEDTVFRALGTLRHARRLAAAEAMQRLSELRLGVALGLVDGLSLTDSTRLTLLVQPEHLRRAVGPITDEEIRSARAAFLREQLAGCAEGGA